MTSRNSLSYKNIKNRSLIYNFPLKQSLFNRNKDIWEEEKSAYSTYQLTVWTNF